MALVEVLWLSSQLITNHIYKVVTDGWNGDALMDTYPWMFGFGEHFGHQCNTIFDVIEPIILHDVDHHSRFIIIEVYQAKFVESFSKLGVDEQLFTILFEFGGVLMVFVLSSVRFKEFREINPMTFDVRLGLDLVGLDLFVDLEVEHAVEVS